MTNNDVFRKILFLTGLQRDVDLIVRIFKLGGVNATESKIKGWRTEMNNDRASLMPDDFLNAFFDGFFLYRDEMRKKGLNIFNFEVNKSA